MYVKGTVGLLSKRVCHPATTKRIVGRVTSTVITLFICKEKFHVWPQKIFVAGDGGRGQGRKSRHPSWSELKELRKTVQESIEEQIHFRTNDMTKNWKKHGSSKLKLIEALMFRCIYFHFSFLLPLWICYQKYTGTLSTSLWHLLGFRQLTCRSVKTQNFPDIFSNPVCYTWRQDASSSMQAANCTASAMSGKSQAQRGTMINAASPNAILNA